MQYDSPKSPFTRATLTGVFVGFMVTVICLVFNAIFRTSTGFLPADFINVSSLIFALNLVFWMIGMIYALMLHKTRKADGIFELLFILLMGFCIWRGATVHRWDDAHLNAQFKTLLEGIILISTIGILLIPYLYRHRKFTEYVV
jgi:hypothetical protein